MLEFVTEAEKWAMLTQTDCVPWLEEATEVRTFLENSPLSGLDLTELEEIVNREQELSERLRVTQNSLRVLLAWCDRMLIDDKHLIGSICKQADDVQLRHAISEAKKILKGA